jgi:rhodanese-related sulfurtransferase
MEGVCLMTAKAHRWTKFWWQDYERDAALRSCSLAAQGLWMRLLCFMHDGEPYGHLTVNGKIPDTKRLAGMIGKPEREIAAGLRELDEAAVFSRDHEGVIYCRRMARDQEAAARGSEAGARGGNPSLARGTVPKDERVRPYRRSDSPEKTERIFQKRGGCCWWCDVPLSKDEPGPTFFHVDHLIPVRDGGTNDEGNLVPACSKCNHERARKDWPPPGSNGSDNNVGGGSDNNVGGFPTLTAVNSHATRSQKQEAEARSRTPLSPPFEKGGRRRRGEPRNGFYALETLEEEEARLARTAH